MYHTDTIKIRVQYKYIIKIQNNTIHKFQKVLQLQSLLQLVKITNERVKSNHPKIITQLAKIET